MWEQLMEIFKGMGSSGTIGAATQGPSLGDKIASGINMGNQFMQLASPNGPLVQGNPMGIYKAGQGIYNNYNTLTMSPEGRQEAMMKQYGLTSTAPSPGVQGSPEILGRGTKSSFAAMTPDVQKEIMKILLGRK